MRRASRTLATLALLWTSVALAHAEFEAGTPAPESVVSEPLSDIRLSFTEPVELRFSIFKTYRLDAANDVDMTTDDAWQRLNGLAGALVSNVLTAQEDGGARVDLGLANDESQSAEVIMSLPPDLAPGVYVVMWRLLAVDTHTTQGFYIFDYQPGDREDE